MDETLLTPFRLKDFENRDEINKNQLKMEELHEKQYEFWYSIMQLLVREIDNFIWKKNKMDKSMEKSWNRIYLFFRMKFIFLKFLLDNGNEFYSSFSIFFFGQFSPELSLQAEFQINLMPYLIYMSLKLLFHYSQFAQFCPFFFN